MSQSQLDYFSQKALTQIMALRVLLADESATIKKVFQLALQDYAVEVVTVNVGVDVAPVAEKIKPDVIFVDVLLQKKNGYDVSAELKANDGFKNIPVVLIWSGFMELDEDKFQASGANAHLEKPFDAKKLRQIVQNLVPKTKTQPISEFLSFPDMPEFQEQKALPEESTAFTDNKSGSWNMDKFADIAKVPLSHSEEDFTELNLPKDELHVAQDSSGDINLDDTTDDEDDNQWVQKPISAYRLDIDPDSDSDHIDVNYDIPDDSLSSTQVKNFVAKTSKTDQDEEYEVESESIGTNKVNTQISKPEISPPVIQSQLSQQRLEEIVRQEVKKAVDDVVWKVVPELAQQLIQKEINRLLTDEESLHDRT